MNEETEAPKIVSVNNEKIGQMNGLRSTKEDTEFYKKAANYWSQIPATVNGMLGGLGYISAIDIQGSNSFIRELRLKGSKNALDCGAGIGRVTKNLLIPRFDSVDIVEQDANFAQHARNYCTTENGCTLGSLRDIFNIGLQEFTPTVGKYDLIWSQWVLGHLTDNDLLEFFRRIQTGLNGGGVFVLKENVTSKNEAEKDDTDSSVTRPLKSYEKLIRKSGLRIVKTTRQQGFPKGLYPVYMIACRPQKT